MKLSPILFIDKLFKCNIYTALSIEQIQAIFEIMDENIF